MPLNVFLEPLKIKGCKMKLSAKSKPDSILWVTTGRKVTVAYVGIQSKVQNEISKRLVAIFDTHE
jgi:hypothetical protein